MFVVEVTGSVSVSFTTGYYFRPRVKLVGLQGPSQIPVTSESLYLDSPKFLSTFLPGRTKSFIVQDKTVKNGEG